MGNLNPLRKGKGVPTKPAGLSDEIHQTLVRRLMAQSGLLTPMHRILTGLVISVLVSFAAFVGYVWHGWSWLDSLYMVVITVFGVGYGEVHPLNTPSLRWLTMGLIFLGYAAAIYTVGAFAQLIINGELKTLLGMRRMRMDIEHLDKHTIVCGYGRMGSLLVQSLAARGRPAIVIDWNAERVREARDAGHLALEGNATEEDVLRAAGVERAGTLATVLSDDVANVFITITAHNLNPQLEILARAEQPSTTKKLRQVGARHVILPTAIGADRLANMILRPSAESMLRQLKLPEGLNDDLAAIGLRLDELELKPDSPLVGDKLSALRLHGQRFGVLIVALRQAGGSVLINPPPSTVLSAGDCVIMLAHEEDIHKLCEQFALQSELGNQREPADRVE